MAPRQIRPPVCMLGPEKAGTNLLARLLGLLGYSGSRSSLSRFIPSSPNDTLGLPEAEFAADPQRVRIWSWPTAGVPRSLVVETLSGVGPAQFGRSHAPHAPELEQILHELGHAVIMIIRDPRDAALSMARSISQPHPGY